MNMCTALDELKQEGRREGRQEGKIVGFIEASREFGVSRDVVEKKIREAYGLTVEKAAEYMEKSW